ncbi:MAG: carboxymuconolactone decarboxylase family protein [Rhodomicrobium sp.]|nr:carboxymuconolactone decarboxylase family protein [Rhodomicrobium sp.]
MKARLDPNAVAPDAMKAMRTLDDYVHNCGLEQQLMELVKIRASQINGCAFSIGMYTQNARKHGESEARIYLLDAWRETPLYSERERAALAWTEALTLIAETHAPDDAYNEVRRHFSAEETVKLSLLIVTVNSWNRLATSARSLPHLEAEPE